MEGGGSEAQGLAASGTQNEARRLVGETCQSEHMEDLLGCVPGGLSYTPLFLLRSLPPSPFIEFLLLIFSCLLVF